MFNSIAQGLLDLLVCTEMIDTCYMPNPVNSSMEAKRKEKKIKEKAYIACVAFILHTMDGTCLWHLVWDVVILLNDPTDNGWISREKMLVLKGLLCGYWLGG